MPHLLDSASKLRAALLKRDFSARDLLAATLAAIERLNPALNAVVQMDAAAAWRAAADSDARISRGEARPLEGLPVTIKDCFEAAGMVTAVGAPALRDYVPKEDASVVARLRRAGAIVLGKTNVPLMTGDFQTTNTIYGTTNNPWNLDRSPGRLLGRCRSRGRDRHERPRSRFGSRRLHPVAGALLRDFWPENDMEPRRDLRPYPADARDAS